MIGTITLGIAGIVFLLGVIVLQLGKTTYSSIAVFIVALMLSGLLGLIGLTGAAGI